ncbi:ClpXP protease specificity-enhancing factor [Endozoicomonadaceae bacterium StTr2]
MTMTSSRPYIARALYDWILENNCTPHILVDAVYPGVRVPKAYVKDNQIVLNVAPAAVRNFEMGNEWFGFEGRFGGVSTRIEFPVGALMAIYARENGQGMVFEIETGNEPPPEGDGKSTDIMKPVEPAGGDDKPPKKPGRPSLRVVK